MMPDKRFNALVLLYVRRDIPSDYSHFFDIHASRYHRRIILILKWKLNFIKIGKIKRYMLKLYCTYFGESKSYFFSCKINKNILNAFQNLIYFYLNLCFVACWYSHYIDFCHSHYIGFSHVILEILKQLIYSFGIILLVNLLKGRF